MQVTKIFVSKKKALADKSAGAFCFAGIFRLPFLSAASKKNFQLNIIY